MKTLKDYIAEDFTINGTDAYNKYYKYAPNDKIELCKLLKKLLQERGPDADLNDIDTSAITDMSKLFYDLNPHNIDISDWDVSNVEYMDAMFWECNNVNCDLSNWDISNVENMDRMFAGCDSLKNKPIWYKK